MNKVILIGNVGQEPTTKQVGETQVTTFTLATNKKTKGEYKTLWHNIKTFGKLADICAQYVHKGKMVAIEGELNYYTYEKDGVQKNGTEILASEVTLLSSKSAGADQNPMPF